MRNLNLDSRIMIINKGWSDGNFPLLGFPNGNPEYLAISKLWASLRGEVLENMGSGNMINPPSHISYGSSAVVTEDFEIWVDGVLLHTYKKGTVVRHSCN